MDRLCITQEPVTAPQTDREEAGRVLRTLEVELARNVVASCSDSDVVTVWAP